MAGGERSGGGGPKRTCTCEFFDTFPNFQLMVKKDTICHKSTFAHCILMHMPLKWKPASHALSSRRSPTINGPQNLHPQNLCIELIGGKLLLQLCAGVAPAITWATQPGT